MVDELLGLPEARWRDKALIFNFHPAIYLHDSWCSVLKHGDMVRRLRNIPAATPQVSHYLLRAFGLERDYCLNFSSPWARLALLDETALKQVFLFLGLALRSDELRREIIGERWRSLKGKLGSEALNFGIKQVPLLGTIPNFAYEPDAQEPDERFTLIGARYCALRLIPLGNPIARRLALKLPAAWCARLNAIEPVELSSTDSTNWPPLLRKLIREFLPQWNPLFA